MVFVLLAHVAATWTMVGLIWFVQIVHYPLFAQVGTDLFSEYEAAHNLLTTWVVDPPMLVEGATVLVLLLPKPERISSGQVWFGMGLLLMIWVSTAFLQVPQHDILTQGFDAKAHHFLVTTNWVRTVAWTLRGVLVLMILGYAMKNGSINSINARHSGVIPNQSKRVLVPESPQADSRPERQTSRLPI